MIFRRPLLLLAAALPASALSLHAASHQIDSPPGTPPTPPSPRPWSSRRAGRGAPLRAYTVADAGDGLPWLPPLFRLPASFADLASHFGTEDSLFSFEGGGAVGVAAKPHMPNLEAEAEAIMATRAQDDELLLELSSLTEKFEDLQSSMDYKSQLYSETIKGYEYKVGVLEEQNALLEGGLRVLTANLEEHEQQVEELLREKELRAAKENDRAASENAVLRRRLHQLELELSDAAFSSRKIAAPVPAVHASNAAAAVADRKTRLSPKAPSAPVPAHLRRQADRRKREPSGVITAFRAGVGRGMKKVGRALSLWSPVHNAFLWGELRGN